MDWGPGLPSALARWSRDLGRNWRENLGWAGEEGSSELKFITADYFVDLHPVASTTEEIRKVHDAWEAVVAAARTAMASRLPQGSPVPLVIQACDVWNRMGVEESIGYTARISPAVSAVACSLIMLVATRSWRVTVAAVGTIAIAVLGMLAALVSLGWEMCSKLKIPRPSSVTTGGSNWLVGRTKRRVGRSSRTHSLSFAIWRET